MPRLDDNFVYVPFEINPQGIWLGGIITEHPSYAKAASAVYPIEEEDDDVIWVKVPRRHDELHGQQCCNPA